MPDVTKSCLAGCAAEYECKPLNNPGPAGEQAESFAPWVKVQFGQGSDIITVGNESYPAGNNRACIKSFECGWIDTEYMNIEVLDEAGGRMGALVDTVRKCAKEQTGGMQGTRMRVQFGWIIATCEGQKKRIASDVFVSEVLEIQVNYSEGKIKYNIKGGPLQPIFEDMREDKTIGEDDKPVSLEEAIRQLSAQDPPINVKYCWREKDGKIKCGKFKWYKFPEGGPKATWQADNQNRIAVISKWIESFRYDDGSIWGKGIIPIFDNKKPDELILLVDPQNNPGDPMSCGDFQNLGTFIVNGGKCSPVIEFTPTFNWIRGFANFSAGGGTSGPGSTANNFHENKKTDQQEKQHGSTAGLQQQVTITQQAWTAYGPKNAWEEMMRSSQSHAKANRLTEVNVDPITADLKILGDPRDKFTQIAAGCYCSVVAINPFHISGNSNGGCGDWMAQPLCNQILSNKNWQVLGINHSIKEGSYTTTLKLRLGAPGIDIGGKEPLGSEGGNGPSVKNTCP